MKSAIVLAAVCAAGSAIAGPMGKHGSHGKHAHFHHAHGKRSNGPGGYVSANATITPQSVYAATGGVGADSTSVLQPADPTLTPVYAPLTTDTTTSLQVLSTADGKVHALSPVTDTVYKTVYSTITYNVGAGKSITQTTTQYSSVVTEYVTTYVTVTIGGDQPSPEPTGSVPDQSAQGVSNDGPKASALETSTPDPEQNGEGNVAGPGDMSSYHDAYHTKTYSNFTAPVANATNPGLPALKLAVVQTTSKKTTTTKKPTTTKKTTTTTKKTSAKTTVKTTTSTKKADKVVATPATSSKTTTKAAATTTSKTTTKAAATTTSKTTTKVATTTTTKTTTTSSGVATVAAPGPTGTGTVSGCTKWYVAQSGDYCSLIATNNGIPTDTFMSWNPSVNPPSCNTLYAGYAYCVAIGGSAGSSVSSTGAASTASSAKTTSAVVASSTTSTAAATATAGSYAYKMYTGNGTVAAGWPYQSQWVDFETLWSFNVPIMQQSCSQWNVPNNNADEIANLKTAIQSVASSSGVDARFILAIVMQESNGCVRVITTSWSVQNPGLMQSHNGAGSCNRDGVVQTPCPAAEITQMIKDGTQGTADGDGLVQCIEETNWPSTGVAKYYKAARIYNGGVGGYNADNLGAGCCTLCYSSDVANRLTGWHSGASGCTLGTA